MTERHDDPHMMCERYLLGELTEEERSGFEYHLLNCQTCRERVTAGAHFIQGIRPVQTPARWEGFAAYIVTGAVAGVALSGVWTVLVLFPFRVVNLVPLIIASGCFLAMGISILHRYSQGFREWWDDHICRHMEKHL